MRRQRPRRGFGILMVIMMLAVAATVIALSYPALMHFQREVRVGNTARLLKTVALATSQISPVPAATYPVFRQRVGTNPGQLSELFGPIASGDAVNYPDACGTTFAPTNQTNSRAWAPFLPFAFDRTTGMATPMGTASNTLTRVQVGTNFYLVISIPNADLVDIGLLDNLVDNGDGAAAGIVQWTSIVGGVATLQYYILTDNAC